MFSAETDFSSLYDTFSDSNLQSANLAYTERALDDMQYYVPLEFGPLRASGSVVDHETIEWTEAQYAGVQYYAQFQNYTTPGTGPYWDKVASGNHMKSWEKTYLGGLGL